LKIKSLEIETFTLPLVETVTTSAIFDGRESVSDLERRKRLNLASPKVFPASDEYVRIGAGTYLKMFSIFWLIVIVSFSAGVDCPKAPAVTQSITTIGRRGLFIQAQ
jgi:hypothetical protein